MSKKVRIILISVGVVIVLAAVTFVAGTANMDRMRQSAVPSVDMSRIPDGDYPGACDIGRWALAVKVAVKDHQVVKVEIVDKKSSNITGGIVARIDSAVVCRATPAFDAVSGATMTSKAYVIAIADALHKGMQ